MRRKSLQKITAIILTAGFFAAGMTSAYAYKSGKRIWAHKFVGTTGQADYGVDIAIDRAKNVYVAGCINSNGLYGDFAVIKYAPSGKRLWKRRYSGASIAQPESPVSVGVDNKGGVYVAGTVEVNSNRDFRLIKYNSAGTLKWVRRFGARGKSEDIVTAMAVSSNGNVYLAGVSDRHKGHRFDYLTVKYNARGRKKWSRRYDSRAHREDYVNDLAIDKNGNAYLTGYSIRAGTSSRFLTVKYGPRGRRKWSRTTGGNGTNIAKAIAVGKDNIFVTGTCYSTDGAKNLTVKYNTRGRKRWANQYAGSAPGNYSSDGITLGRSGSVYVAGENLDFSTGRSDVAVIKYNARGQQRWVKVFGGKSDLDYEFSAIGSDEHGNVYIAGMSEGFESKADIFIAKYSSSGAPRWNRSYSGRSGGEDRANGLAVRRDGFTYLTGSTYSNDSKNVITIGYAR